jgi:Family of unknown function (DUF6519)
MKADFSRRTFDRTKHYAGVLMQQGRVAVDADWNEQHEIAGHRTQTETVDVIGLCGTPLDPPSFTDASGFRLALTAAGTSVTIGAGRYYVDGLLAENEKTIDYADQGAAPYELPAPTPILKLLPNANDLGLVYLDVWRRHVTPLEDPLIQEKALGDADTATRIRTAWQVNVLPLPGVAPPVMCDAKLGPWDALVAASTGTLQAVTHPPATAPDPCEPPPKAGFTRLENQLYRVEIHRGTKGGAPTFKWSRENASIVTDVRSFDANNWITVGSMGRDEELGFAKDQWVELVNDFSELNTDGTLRGQLTTIIDVNPGKNAIRLADAPADTALARHPRLRRWDMLTKGPPETVTVTTNGITVQPGIEVPLEDGISVEFSNGTYHDGDYWLIPARTTIGDIEWPKDGTTARALPPVGVKHHFCRLGFVQRSGSKLVLLSDCREKFPPLTELTSFFYVGGDGQEVMPDPSGPTASTPVELPEPLQVGVANGGHPVQGATVRFEIFNPAPAGTVDGKPDFVEVSTTADGVASCTWAIASDQQKQQVRATLRINGAPSHLPIVFSAERSRADEVRYFPPDGCAVLGPAHDVQSAIDRLGELVHLTYVSGDAQEVAPADRDKLMPLEVRAWSDCGPVAGASVEFKLLEGGDSITSPGSTSPDGLATAQWVLDATSQRQRAVATLVNLGDALGPAASIHQPTSSVEFIANLDLTTAPPLKPVIRIEAVERGDKKPLVNDDDVQVADLLAGAATGNVPGITITTDRPIDPDTIGGKKTRSEAPTTNSHPACFVSIELPWPAVPGDREFWGSGHLPLGFETIILAAEVTAKGKEIFWRPYTETRQWLLTLLDTHLKGTDRVLAHLTLKGCFIHDKEDSAQARRFLDGEPFGPRPSVGLQPLSGDREPGGDFELWFWLVPRG